MKIRNNNILKQVGNDYVIIPIDDLTSDLDKVFKLNTVGYEIYNILKTEHTFDEVIELLLKKYSVDKDILTNDVKKFIDELNNKGLLDV